MGTFGERLKHFRLAADLTQEELANKCGMKKQSISRYEKSDREPNIYIAKAIAEALGISLEALVGDKQSMGEVLDKFDLQYFGPKDDLAEELQMLRDNPDTRTLLHSSKGLTHEQLAAVAAIMKQMRGSE